VLIVGMSPPSALMAAPPAIAWRARPPASLPVIAEPAAAVEAMRAEVPVHVIVQLERTADAAGRGRLARAGVTLQAPLGGHAYFARLEPHRAAGAALLEGLRSVGPIDPELKIHPLVREGGWPAWASDDRGEEEMVAALVLCHRDVPAAAARAAAEAAGAVVRTGLAAVTGLVVELPLTAVATLAARDEVMWIEPPLPPLSTMNAENRRITQADLVQTAPYGLDGADVVAMVYDGGAALPTHLDFGGRLTVGDESNLSNHATHVCGTIGGDGAASGGSHRGMAPAATLLSYGFQFQGDSVFLYANPGDLENDYVRAIGVHGAVLANNSIGTNVAVNGFPCEMVGDYGITSAIIDAIVRGALGAPLRVVWAVGNERESGACGDAYGTVAPPAGAKNHLAVGAIDAADNAVTCFTSWGPLDDGRLKPDLCAPGCQSGGDSGVTSTTSSGSYAPLCGTSMAAPTVTGIAALLLQDLRQQHPHRADPSPALTKALLIHAAADLESPGPDYRTGFGLVQIRDTIDFVRDGGYVEASVDQDQAVGFIVDVEDVAVPLRVTLAWDDPPGTPNVTGSLVNDLDLLVTGPGGTFHPWTLDPAAADAPAVRAGPDRLNNVEQVVIDAPEPGRYVVTVTGFEVPAGPQPFALAAGPDLVGTVIGLPGPLPDPLEPGAARTVVVDVRSVGETVMPDSVTMHVRAGDGPFAPVPMTPAGPERYEAVLAAPEECGGEVAVYFTAVGSVSGAVAMPPDGAIAPSVLAVSRTVSALDDDFEIDLGWTVTSTPGLINGAWERGVPAGAGTRGDPLVDADGSGQCFLTDNAPGNSDVDGGGTTLTSPVLVQSLERPVVAYARWFSTVQGSNPFQDVMLVEVSDDGGASWRELETVGPAGPDSVGGWIERSFHLTALPGFDIAGPLRVRFTVTDTKPSSVVEAAIDAVRVTSAQCGVPCPADLDGDGRIDVDDLVALIQSWGPCPETSTPCADLDGDGIVGADDLVAMLLAWGDCTPP
jgi:hypothetical protein